jgi:hypothetical protein
MSQNKQSKTYSEETNFVNYILATCTLGVTVRTIYIFMNGSPVDGSSRLSVRFPFT